MTLKDSQIFILSMLECSSVWHYRWQMAYCSRDV